MNPNQALWEKGDFTRIAASMRGSGAALVRQAGIGPGLEMLDLGCGDGTTALPAAQAGANVLGVDIARNLVDAGKRRAGQAGLASRLRFQHGDACALTDLKDDSFDRVVSIFGAMFAPKPNDVAREMVRVTKPGGRIVMGNWIPGDPTLVAQLLKTCSAYTPPPPEGFISPMGWGVDANVKERFAAAGMAPESVQCERDIFVFDHDGPPAQYVDLFLQYYGPTMSAHDAATQAGRAQALRDDLVALFERENRAADPQRTLIPANFLRVTVHVQ